MSIEKLSLSEYVLMRSKDYGDPTITTQNPWLFNGEKFIHAKAQYSDALIGVIGEIIDNTIDHYNRSITSSTPVSYIECDFDGEVITIRNDGPAIPIEMYEKDGVSTWKPTMVFTEERSGANFDDKTNRNRTTGGLNGLGAKLTNIYSIYFKYIICDGKQRFEQVCEHNMSVINEPIIEPCTDAPYVHIEFLPDYDKLCRIEKDIFSDGWINNPDNKELLKNLMYYRFCQIKTAIVSTNYKYDGDICIEYPENKRPRVVFNGEEIAINNFYNYIKMFGVENFFMIKFEDRDMFQYPWTIAIVPSNDLGINKFGQNSIINGLDISSGGNYVECVMKKITSLINEKLKTTFSWQAMSRLFCYFDCRQFPVRTYNFADGNKKKKINIDKIPFNKLKAEYFGSTKIQKYNIPIEQINFVKKKWDALATELAKYSKDNIDKLRAEDLLKKQQRKNNKSFNDHKHDKAHKACGKESMKCGLIISEGDSARGQMIKIINSKDTPINRDYYGLYTLQGVPMNACKESIEIEIDGNLCVVSNESLLNNVVLQGLAQAIGLNYNHKYEDNDTGNAEFRKLNYGFIVLATDQDLDGIGHICSLVMVFLLRFWPNLFIPSRKFFRRLATPIIRVHMKDSYINFYDKRDYRVWLTENNFDDINLPKDIDVAYHKGLGGHSDNEMVYDIGMNIHKNIIVIQYDDESLNNMIRYYGHDSTSRKEILSNGIDTQYQVNDGYITITDHFNVQTKMFQMDFMRRKIRNAVDGFIVSQRKVFAAARKLYKGNGNKITKISKLTGDTTSKFAYEHGEASLDKVIIKMAQNFPGSNNIPPLIRKGDFGNIMMGRGISVAPRYLHLNYNKFMDLMFPPIDDPLLEYVFDEGERCEPVYYVPIMPYSILESEKVPAAGWNTLIWARDWDAVIDNVRALINGHEMTSLLGQTAFNTTHHVRVIDTEKGQIEIAECDYEYNRRTATIHIKQLPPRTWTNKYRCELLGIESKTGKPIMVGDKNETDKDSAKYRRPKGHKCGIISVTDDTDTPKNDIDIKIKVDNASIDQVCEILRKRLPNEDPIKRYFGLTKILSKQLNMINRDNYITEYKTYEDIIEDWFVVRRDLYIARIERLRKITNHKLNYYKEILRFIEMDFNNEINIDVEKEDESRHATLEENNFIKFNKDKLFKNKLIPNDKLDYYILGPNASYGYIDAINKSTSSKSGIRSLNKHINDLSKELLDIEEYRWEELWLNELEVLDAEYKKIMANGGWVVEKDKKCLN